MIDTMTELYEKLDEYDSMECDANCDECGGAKVCTLVIELKEELNNLFKERD